MSNLKLNKSIKSEIIQMAIRKKFEVKFKDNLEKLTSSLKEVAEKETSHHLFSGLDSHVLNCLRKSQKIIFPSDVYIRPSDNVKTALSIRYCIDSVSIKDSYIYGSELYFIPLSMPQELTDFIKFMKSIEEFNSTLELAIAPFKSTKKMFNELPWTEELYPSSYKAPACNIVSLSTIESANELMKGI